MSVNILQDGNLLSIAGGGSTGHQILNEQGRIFPQRENLKFVNSDIQDDSTNNTTVITPQGGGGGSDPATPTTLGLVKPDNETILVDQQGIISANEFVGTAAQAQAALTNLEEGATVYITDDYGDEAVPIATTSVAGKVKPDGTDIDINATGLLLLDPNKLKIDRKRILPNGNGMQQNNYFPSSISMISQGQNPDEDIYTFSEAGIFIFNAFGLINLTGNQNFKISLRLKSSSRIDTIAISCIGGASGSIIGYSLQGLAIAKSGDKINFDINNTSSASGAGTIDSIGYSISKIYSFTDSSTASYWWQQDTIS